ncbi:MAG: hypothetical protein AB1324_04925 [Candidatus Micrarchaeota archaeon]
MANECMMGCPECSMSSGYSAPVMKAEGGFRCSANPAHRFTLGNDGFLKSL